MHTQTATRTWYPANDNERDVPFEPPSLTPVAAQTVLIARTDNDVVLCKDAAPAHLTGFTETGACSEAPKIALDLSTWLFVRGADPLIRIPANDL
jgi:hypothetical protein